MNKPIAPESREMKGLIIFTQSRWFPSPKSEMMIRERILALTGNNALALTTPEEAKEILIPVLREWGELLFTQPCIRSLH